MFITTQVADIGSMLDLTDYAGDFVDDFDMDAVRRDYLAAVNARVPYGVIVAANGMVFAEYGTVADAARNIDWQAIAEDINVSSIFDANDRA